MRFVALRMQNWRGVSSRELTFGEGVTVIEGPNEIGKSAIVEAISLLFGELDSSKKLAVKSIKPVDQDVGSTIEAEIVVGDTRLVYSKTFNKSPQTTLKILEPSQRQATGRAAHEQVEQLLESTVDMGLWKALLVDQGEKVKKLETLQDSDGLAKALDEAAGSTSSGGEDSGLFSLVQHEYEQYFTLKTGKSKFTTIEKDTATSKEVFESAAAAVLELEETSQRSARVTADLKRLQSKLPELRQGLDALNEQWASIKRLKDSHDLKQKDLDSAIIRLQSSTEAQADRKELIDKIKETEVQLRALSDRHQPERQQADGIRQQCEKAQSSLETFKLTRTASKTAYSMAGDDHRHLLEREKQDSLQVRLKQLNELSRTMTVSLETAASIKVSKEVLKHIQDAEQQLVIAQQTRDAAATAVTVTAESALEMEMDGESLSLKENDQETRTVARNLSLRFPGLARVDLSPSQSVANLDDQVSEASTHYANLLTRFEVSDMSDALTKHEVLSSAQQDIDRHKSRHQEILGQDSQQEIEQQIATAQSEWDRYVRQRKLITPMPSSLDEATTRLKDARTAQESDEQALENANDTVTALQTRLTDMDRYMNRAEQDLAGIQAVLTERQQRVDRDRSAEADEALDLRVTKATTDLQHLEQETRQIGDRLAESTPDAIEARRTNAEQVLTRAQNDLKDTEKQQAILADRLEQAQADGRFETMERAKQSYQRLSAELIATHRRAAAVERLWTTLNEHRNKARLAYVRPLKDAIERLGIIVFGAGFEVDIGEDWSLISRTLNGKTLPFDDLSIGAKEQLGILTRLAAAQIVSSQGGVPLIIDDALGFSDPMRLETMGAAIAAAGRECQVIILTCTPDRFMHVGSAEIIRLSSDKALEHPESMRNDQ